MNNECHFVIERDADGLYVASVPQLPGCHTQARTLEDLTGRIQEAIEVWLEAEGQPQGPLDFVGIQKIRAGS